MISLESLCRLSLNWWWTWDSIGAAIKTLNRSKWEISILKITGYIPLCPSRSMKGSAKRTRDSIHCVMSCTMMEVMWCSEIYSDRFVPTTWQWACLCVFQGRSRSTYISRAFGRCFLSQSRLLTARVQISYRFTHRNALDIPNIDNAMALYQIRYGVRIGIKLKIVW